MTPVSNRVLPYRPSGPQLPTVLITYPPPCISAKVKKKTAPPVATITESPDSGPSITKSAGTTPISTESDDDEGWQEVKRPQRKRRDMVLDSPSPSTVVGDSSDLDIELEGEASSEVTIIECPLKVVSPPKSVQAKDKANATEAYVRDKGSKHSWKQHTKVEKSKRKRRSPPPTEQEPLETAPKKSKTTHSPPPPLPQRAPTQGLGKFSKADKKGIIDKGLTIFARTMKSESAECFHTVYDHLRRQLAPELISSFLTIGNSYYLITMLDSEYREALLGTFSKSDYIHEGKKISIQVTIYGDTVHTNAPSIHCITHAPPLTTPTDIFEGLKSELEEGTKAEFKLNRDLCNSIRDGEVIRYWHQIKDQNGKDDNHGKRRTQGYAPGTQTMPFMFE
ncbi:hypothetical protein DFH27DRAFT_637170 [Peziza echinospora]|nr:hypothetical protein DFH27DRAFT_637170 [Peziza echinospora]